MEPKGTSEDLEHFKPQRHVQTLLTHTPILLQVAHSTMHSAALQAPGRMMQVLPLLVELAALVVVAAEVLATLEAVVLAALVLDAVVEAAVVAALVLAVVEVEVVEVALVLDDVEAFPLVAIAPPDEAVLGAPVEVDAVPEVVVSLTPPSPPVLNPLPWAQLADTRTATREVLTPRKGRRMGARLSQKLSFGGQFVWCLG